MNKIVLEVELLLEDDLKQELDEALNKIGYSSLSEFLNLSIRDALCSKFIENELGCRESAIDSKSEYAYYMSEIYRILSLPLLDNGKYKLK